MNKNFLFLSVALLFVTTITVWAVGSAGQGSQGSQDASGVQQGTPIQNNDNQGDDSGQVENQNQIQNQGEDSNIQNQEREESEDDEDESGNVFRNVSETAQQHRSQVANAVQEMLKIAERNGGIGDQVRIMAQNQNQNQERIAESLEKIQSRKRLVEFFIGANYKEIKTAEKILAQNREQITQLNELKNQLKNQADASTIALQVQVLEQANNALQNILNEEGKVFSLFGWAFRWLVK